MITTELTIQERVDIIWALNTILETNPTHSEYREIITKLRIKNRQVISEMEAKLNDAESQ